MPWRRGGFIPYCGKHRVINGCFKKRKPIAIKNLKINELAETYKRRLIDWIKKEIQS